MSQTVIAVADVPSIALAALQAEVPPVEQARPNAAGAFGRVLWWVKEGLLVVAVAYAFPIAILAIGVPVALTINGLLIAAGWAWNSAF